MRRIATREEAVEYGAELGEARSREADRVRDSNRPWTADLPLTMIGVSYQPGVARALSIDFIDAVKPVLEDAAADEDRARREGGDAGAGEARRGGARIPARRDAVCVSAVRRSGRLFARRAGRTLSRSQAGRGGRAARRSGGHAGRTPGAGDRRAGFSGDLRNHRSAAGGRAGAHGADRHPRRSGAASRLCRSNWTPTSSGCRRKSTNWRESRSTSIRRCSSARFCSRS